MNNHDITVDNYRDKFVLVLAKSGAAILADWMNVPVNVISGDHNFVKPTNHLHVWHMSTGLLGEALEYYECMNVANPDSTPEEELADALFYSVGISRYVDIDDWTDFAFMNEDPCDDRQYLFSAMELDDKIKKYNVYNNAAVLVEVKTAWVQFMVNWSSKAAEHFTVLQDVIDENVAKLSKRYDGICYSNKAAAERLDKVPQGELESDQDSSVDKFPSGT